MRGSVITNGARDQKEEKGDVAKAEKGGKAAVLSGRCRSEEGEVGLQLQREVGPKAPS